MSGKAKKILVAEDDAASRMILETLLRKWGFEVISAADGAEAWNIFQADPDIHIIVSDWMMPEVDGIELLQLIRAVTNRRYTFFILLTAKSQIDDIITGLDTGADDFVTKPFNQYELRVRIQAGERVVDLEEQLEKKVNELSKAYRQIKVGLEAAATMQRGMLPPLDGKFPGFRYASAYIPSEAVGGDLFNLMDLGDSRHGIYIFDVSGHGVPAALQSVAMGRMLSPFDPKASLLLRTEPSNGTVKVLTPCEVAGRLNTRFQSASSKGDFITFLYGILDPVNGQLMYTRAGHPAPLLIHNGKVVNTNDKGDIPIGIIPDYSYEENILKLNIGDRLFFYTDGIPEAANPDGERFGEDRMLNMLADTSSIDIQESVNTLVSSVREWQEKEHGDDDMTILGIECTNDT